MGKRTKKEKRRLREERRAAQRRAERRRNLVTLGIVAGIVVIGGALVWASVDREPDPAEDIDVEEPEDGSESDGEGDDQSGEDGEDGEDGDGTDGGDGADGGEGTGGAGEEETSELSDREVACGAEAPAEAGGERPTYDEPGTVLDGVEEATARMATSCGEVVLDLDVERAPQASNSFAFLAREGFFDGLEFFRVRQGLDMVQGGSGNGEGTWDVGYTLPAELEAAEADGYPPGAVALAVPEGEPDGGGSQFFVVYGDRFMDAVLSGALPREHPRFATVVEGLDVVQRIGEIEVGGPGGDTPLERVYIESVEIEAA